MYAKITNSIEKCFLHLINVNIQLQFMRLCHVMLCYVMLCYVMTCYVMLCYVMLCYVMLQVCVRCVMFH